MPVKKLSRLIRPVAALTGHRLQCHCCNYPLFSACGNVMMMKRPFCLSVPRAFFAGLCGSLLAGLGIGAAYADYPAGPSPAITVTMPPAAPLWKLGAAAPALHITTLSGQKISLSQFSGKLIVLEFGSLTEPAFRLSAPSVNWLAHQWKKKVQVLMVYEKESHAAGSARALNINKAEGFAIPQAQDQSQRLADARRAQHALHLQFPLMTIDNAKNQTALAYGALPNMTFLINTQGQLIGAWPWMAPWQLRGAVSAVLSGKPIPVGDMSSGFTASTSPPMEFDYQALPPAAPQTLADAIDRAGVTRQQLSKLLPALTDFSTSLLKARQQLAQLRSRRRQFNGNFRQAVGKTLKGLRKSARELTGALHRYVNNRQYTEILSAIDRGRMRRVFEPRSRSE